MKRGRRIGGAPPTVYTDHDTEGLGMDTTTKARELERIGDAVEGVAAVIGSARALAETMDDDEREAFARNLDRSGFGGRSTVVRDGVPDVREILTDGPYCPACGTAPCEEADR